MSKVFQIYGAFYIAPSARGYDTQSSAHVDAMAITERDLWRNDAALLVKEKDNLRASNTYIVKKLEHKLHQCGMERMRLHSTLMSIRDYNGEHGAIMDSDTMVLEMTRIAREGLNGVR